MPFLDGSRITVSGALASGGVLALIAGQLAATVEADSRLERELLNFTHVPWFFGVSLLVWLVLSDLRNINNNQRVMAYAAIVCGLALGLEVVQIPMDRDADWQDVVRNLIGAGSASLLLLAKWAIRTNRKIQGLGLICCSAALVAIGLRDVAGSFVLRLTLHEQAPVLVDFQRSKGESLVIVRGNWEIVPQLPGWTGPDAPGRLARVSLANSRYPGLTLREPLRDWRDYRWLNIEGYWPARDPLELDVRLETFSDKGLNSIQSVTLEHGKNIVRIPLSVLSAGEHPPSDVKNLFIYKGDEARVDNELFVKSIWLE